MDREKDTKPSTLPHVLQSYDSNYTPVTTPKSKTHVHQCDREKSTGSIHDDKSRSTLYDHSRDNQPDSARGNLKSASTDQNPRSAGRRSRKLNEQQRFEELSNKWDRAKQDVRLEDHEALLEKVSLQQELIRKQDEYAEQIRLQQAETDAEKRETKHAKKQSKHDQLQQICKQSIEEDKTVQREEKKVAKSRLKHGPSPLSTASSPSVVQSSPAKSPTTSGGRRSNSFKMTLPAFPPTPDLPDSDTDSDEEQKNSTPDKVLLWHEQQLYKLYGKKADYFLHPKMENKTQEKTTNPKLHRQGGRAGAEALWHTLRQDSGQRLLKEDKLIPDDLKNAYGAFARQSLKKSRNPVQRMFCAEDDLPDLPRLLDNRKVQRVRKMRYKSDMMYKASVSNQDRTDVLTFNNPLPEFHDRTEGIDQYLPSWQDEFSSDSPQPEYARWLVPRSHVARESTIKEEMEEDEISDLPQVTQSYDDDMMLIFSQRRQAQPKQKYLFLYEKDTTVKGVFSEKYKDRENKDIPQPYKGAATKSYSALERMTSVTPEMTKSNSTLRYSAPLPTRDALLRTYTSNWQPLSMHALIEYKKQMLTVGDGDFNLGRTKMWSHIPVI